MSSSRGRRTARPAAIPEHGTAVSPKKTSKPTSKSPKRRQRTKAPHKNPEPAATSGSLAGSSLPGTVADDQPQSLTAVQAAQGTPSKPRRGRRPKSSQQGASSFPNDVSMERGISFLRKTGDGITRPTRTRSQIPAKSRLDKTPTRGRRKKVCSSTPRRNTTPLKEPEVSPVKKRARSGRPESPQRKRRKQEQAGNEAPPTKMQRKEGGAGPCLPQRKPFTSIRTRFELHESELQDPDDPLSSDLSIELSVQEENHSLIHSLSLEEEEEEDEELPSFLQRENQKPSIREGLCVWCKLRKYPFWPAVVKSVNHKTKKASIVFIDQFLFNKTRICKGLTVSLRTLKPFDCEESGRFADIAKERYGKSIQCCLDLISDYKIRIGCGSFAGSIIDYIADDISYPLRSEYAKASSDLVSPTQSLMVQEGGESDQQECDTPDPFHQAHTRKKELPDRAQAARNRANQKLVDFIVSKRGVESHLLSVISGEETSKWLQSLQSSSHSIVGVYLEDEAQVESMFRYMENLCMRTPKTAPTDHIPFILDVLFPEALIHALAQLETLSLEKAEEKFRRGPNHSNREREAFDRQIERQMKAKAITALSSP